MCVCVLMSYVSCQKCLDALVLINIIYIMNYDIDMRCAEYRRRVGFDMAHNNTDGLDNIIRFVWASMV